VFLEDDPVVDSIKTPRSRDEVLPRHRLSHMLRFDLPKKSHTEKTSCLTFRFPVVSAMLPGSLLREFMTKESNEGVTD
jgi:hypothetical protein